MTTIFVEKLIDYSRSLYTLLGERRKVERVDFKCAVSMTCRHRSGAVSTHVCACLNLSDHGMGLESLEPIPANCIVYIQSARHKLGRVGRIRWTVQKGDHFYAGCDFRSMPVGRSDAGQKVDSSMKH